MASKKHRKNILRDIQNAADKTMPQSNDIFRNEIKYPQTLYRTRQDIATWRRAVNAAENIHAPNRTELYRLYKDVMNDAHLTALINTRKNAILSTDFVVTKNGKVKDDKTEYINKKWLYDFISYAMDSIFWGYSLVQFGDFINDEFIDVTCVPRQYVVPEFGIVADIGMYEGTSYLIPPYNNWYIGIGDKHDLGLLMKAAPLVLWKKGALQAWAEYTEKYGAPYRIVKTDTRDAATHQNAVDMLSQMGSSLWAVLNKADEFELLEAKNTSASDIFNNLIEMCNSELSKLILGQTSTSDQKAYVGSAEVHENILHQVNEADLRFIENIFQYQLIPLLNKHNLGFNGYKIEAKADDEVNLAEKAKIDIELLAYYDIPAEYILETYGTPVVPKASVPKPDQPTQNDSTITDVANKLNYYYGNS